MARRTGVDTATLKTAMSAKWKAPENALVWEVGDATGGRQSRAADAVIMGLWPSRGITLDGVEIKTQRSDWLRELKNPAKAEPVSRYCDHWWIHAGVDVVEPGELPTGWGLRVYDGRTWSTVVDAHRRTPVPISREFLAALLRRSDQQNDKATKAAAAAMLDSERAAIDARVERMVKDRTRKADAMATIAEEFERSLGMSLQDMVRSGEVAIAAKMTAAFMDRNLHDPYFGLPQMVKSMRDLAERTSEAMEAMGLVAPDASDRMPRYDRAAKKGR
jgi:hypothetical protein